MRKNWRKPALCLFIGAECLLTVLVQLTGGELLKWLSFGAIFLACIACLIFLEASSPYIATQIALIGTLCADVCLVLMDPMRQLPAMVAFLAVQTAYAARIHLSLLGEWEKKIHLLIRLLVTALCMLVTMLVLKNRTDPLSLISVVYYGHLVCNAFYAFLHHRTLGKWLAVGLTLFALCDLFVGLNAMEPYIALKPGSFLWSLAHPPFNASWLFYIPAQTCLVISIPKGHQDKKPFMP